MVLWDALSIIALVVNLSSILGASYLLLRKVKLDRERWNSTDTHYQLRVLLCVSLLLNRISQLLNQVFEMTLTIHSFTRPAFVSLALYFITLYVTIYLLLLLTLNRYARVCMVIPGSRQFRFFKAVKWFFGVILMVITLGLLSNAMMEVSDATSDIRQYHPIYIQSEGIRQLFELVGLSLGVPLEYIYTIRLIWSSIRAGIKEFHQEKINTLTEPEGEALQKRKRQLQNLKYHKMKLAFKMISLFFIMLLVDIAIVCMFIVSIMVSSLNVSLLQWTHIRVLLGAWVVVRVWAMFALLDVFLHELKETKCLKVASFRTANTFETQDDSRY